MLYLKPHHAHEAMGKAVGAEFVELDRGNPIDRIGAARRLDIGDRPVITEGGKPLFQAVWMKIFGNCGPIVHLAADETLMNIFNPLEHYRRIDRLSHYWAHRYVDGVLAVSPRLTAEARALGVEHVKTIHPFPTQEKWNCLGEIEPDFESNQLIAVGSNVPKNNFGVLESIADASDHDIHFEVVGPRTEELDAEGVTGHGFVDDETFYDLFGSSQCFVLPARSQAFPVSTLEAMRAGFPTFVSDNTGTQPYIGKIHSKFVRNPESLSASIDWFLELDDERKERYSRELRQMASYFEPERGIQTFRNTYEQLMESIQVHKY